MPLRVSSFLKDLWLTAEIVKAEGLEGKPLTIAKVYQKRVGQENKLVIALDGVQRHLPMNQTNTRAMLEGTGGVDDAMEWIGAKVELYVEPVEFQGEQTEGIRLEVVATRPERKAAAK